MKVVLLPVWTTEYYKDDGESKGREDDIYYVEDGKLKHREYGCHMEPEHQERDKNGVYTLISEKGSFYYFGADNFPVDEIKNILKDEYPLRQETKIIKDSKMISTIWEIVEKNKELEKDTTEKSRNQNQCGECKQMIFR